MRLRKNRKIERAAVNAARAFFEENDCVFQEVDLANDYGKDAYIDIVDRDVVTGTCVAAQIKGGDKYRRADGFAIPVDEDHFQIWRNSSMPVTGIVHDPETGSLYWTSITEFLAMKSSRPTSIPVPRSNLLTSSSLHSAFKPQFRGESQRLGANCVLDLSSDSEDQRLQSISDCFGLGRSDSRILISLRRFLPTFTGASLEYTICVLTHVTPHPDILWSSSNWIPQEVCNAVCKHFRWTIDEIIHLLEAAEWETWQRGDMGEHVYMMLRQDPEIESKMQRVVDIAMRANNDDLAFASTYLCLYWSRDNAMQMYDDLVNRDPNIELLPLMPDVRHLLYNHGCVPLFE
ncbi:MAG: DUF4365 domain-containing protein [Phycisphaerae bacterium]|nr:DUF4365 domain-containing protein [Phycisphaerae bacterium]